MKLQHVASMSARLDLSFHFAQRNPTDVKWSSCYLLAICSSGNEKSDLVIRYTKSNKWSSFLSTSFCLALFPKKEFRLASFGDRLLTICQLNDSFSTCGASVKFSSTSMRAQVWFVFIPFLVILSSSKGIPVTQSPSRVPNPTGSLDKRGETNCNVVVYICFPISSKPLFGW